jgi:indole-3-glycerol phosphate synthase
MRNFLKSMYQFSKDRADCLPASVTDNKLGSPVYKLKLNAFDIIAEIKKTSPAEGELASPELDCLKQANEYILGGAAAISVLTEPTKFDGHIKHLNEVTIGTSKASIPIMRKDFLVDVSQILESRQYGASGILLISDFLSRKELNNLLDCAFDHSMFVLLESFGKEDLKKSLSLLENAKYSKRLETQQLLFGINSRDLRTLDVNLQRLSSLAREIPESILKVAESGIKSRENIMQIRHDGYDLALIGSTLMRAEQPKVILQDFLKIGRGQK